MNDGEMMTLILMGSVKILYEIKGVFLVFEYCEHDISALLDHVRTPFSESEIKSLVYQLLSAVAYLHDHWIIHRGMKSAHYIYYTVSGCHVTIIAVDFTLP